MCQNAQPRLLKNTSFAAKYSNLIEKEIVNDRLLLKIDRNRDLRLDRQLGIGCVSKSSSKFGIQI